MAKMKFSDENPTLRAANKALTKMKYPDLKIACIVRGMLFEDVVEGSFPSLSSFFIRNYETKQDRGRLEDFDIWMDEQLEKNGHPIDSPLRQYRLSTTLDDNNDVKVQTKKLKRADIPKKKRTRKERDKTFNIFKGTKKALTYELASKGKASKEIIEAVMAEFPEAKPKSIAIWIKRAQNEKKDKR